jgi:hypothetical protein
MTFEEPAGAEALDRISNRYLACQPGTCRPQRRSRARTAYRLIESSRVRLQPFAVAALPILNLDQIGK